MPQHVRRRMASRAADASPTICQTRCRVSLRPPRAINKNGEFSISSLKRASEPPSLRDGSGFRLLASRANTGRACARYSRSASCADLPSGTMRSLSPLPRTSMYPASSFRSSSFGVHHFRNAQRSRIKNFQHGAIANRESHRILRLRVRFPARERRRQRRFHFVARQRLRQNFPLPRRFDIQSRICSIFLSSSR